MDDMAMLTDDELRAQYAEELERQVSDPITELDADGNVVGDPITESLDPAEDAEPMVVSLTRLEDLATEMHRRGMT